MKIVCNLAHFFTILNAQIIIHMILLTQNEGLPIVQTYRENVLSKRERMAFMKSIKFIVTALFVLCLFSLSAETANAGKSAPPVTDICPVHGIKMQSVKMRVVYGMPSRLEFEEKRVGKSLFPYGRDYILAGCVVKPEKFRQGFICPKCVKARNEWMASKKR
jgi:hypothetical protein